MMKPTVLSGGLVCEFELSVENCDLEVCDFQRSPVLRDDGVFYGFRCSPFIEFRFERFKSLLDCYLGFWFWV